MANTSNNLNGRVITALIDFDLVVNTELGLIRLVREKFQDERAFNLEILNRSDKEILSLLFSRKNPNPLSIISTEENLPDIDKLYDSFFQTYKKEIINRSNSDAHIFKFAKYVVTSSANLGANAFFAVSDELERSSLVDHFGSMTKTIMKEDGKSLLGKDVYYIRDYRFFTDHNLQDKISRKKIYMSSRQFNLDYFEDVTNSLTSRNVFILFGKNYADQGGPKNEPSGKTESENNPAFNNDK